MAENIFRFEFILQGSVTQHITVLLLISCRRPIDFQACLHTTLQLHFPIRTDAVYTRDAYVNITKKVTLLCTERSFQRRSSVSS